MSEETKIEEVTEELEQKDDAIDISKYEANLEREENDNDTSKLVAMLDKQDAMITQLKAEIKNLKDMNMALALNAGNGQQPQSAVDALNAAFNIKTV